MNTKKLTFSAMCVVVNLVLGTVMGMIQIPLLFLDTIGTILGAVVLGPLWGALIGGCSNLVLGVISDPTNIPFAIVNIATGLIVGFMAKKGNFGYKKAIITGIILAVVCPMIGTPISVYMFGGLSGFIPRILSNIVDKPLSCLLVVLFISKMPKNFLAQFKSQEN